MGKNHRHKKNLKADKAKVKLKQNKTKFLPKGLNETKATFKIKPIVLPDQLKEKNTDLPLSKRKLNIKDLCSRINHYNENVRTTACEELADIFKHFTEEIIRDNLSEVILSVSNLMQDRERKVRNAAVKVITIILQLTPSERLEPFFNYFSTNMRCAMTNIDQHIQEDSLKFLDCFLIKDCGFIAQASEKLLPDFFTLISRLKIENSLNRTLTLNLGSKMTSVSWRIKVLSRLHAILDLILNKNELIQESNISIFAENCVTLPIYNNSFHHVLKHSNWYIQEENNMDKRSLDSHLSSLIPVFHEIWMEILPHQQTKKIRTEITVLNDEASAILGSIVNTIYLLWKYIEKLHSVDSDLKNIFISTEATTFLTHLLANFPYTRNDDLKMKNRLKSNVLSLNLNEDQNCVKENIIICYIYFILNANFSRKSVGLELKCIEEYISKCLLTKNYIDHSNIYYMIEFIRMCLVEKCHVWKKSSVDARLILQNVMHFYNNENLSDKNKLKIIKIFSELHDNLYLSKCEHYHHWLSSIVELLCQPKITDNTVQILLELARKSNVHFLKAIKDNMYKILTNLDNIKILLTTKNSYKDDKIIKRDIAFIFYYLKEELSCNELEQLIKYLANYISRGDCYILKEKLHKCSKCYESS